MLAINRVSIQKLFFEKIVYKNLQFEPFCFLVLLRREHTEGPCLMRLLVLGKISHKPKIALGKIFS